MGLIGQKKLLPGLGLAQGGTGDHEVVKTVYDPSPRGFKLPNRNAFTGFTSDGNTQTSASNIYGDWVGASGEQPAGRNFSTTHSTSDKTFFIPASGSRDGYSSSQLGGVSTEGYYWSAAPGTATGGYRLTFGSSGVFPQNNGLRTFGFSVRPVQE